MIGQRRLIPSSGGYELPLDVYVPQVSQEIDPDARRAAVVILPGGAYMFRSEREAEPIALQFAAAGFNAFVAQYRVAPNRFPVPLEDAGAAVAYVRAHADELATDPDRIAILGFSAGGHLTASLGTRWQEAGLWTGMGLAPQDVKPNAMVLCYPVINGGACAHRGSFEALTGSADVELHKRFSADGWVTPACPPTFLWSTFEDEAVPVENSLLMAMALKQNQIPAELHVFPHGLHGGSLFQKQTAGVKAYGYIDDYNAQWLGLAVHFLRDSM